MGSDAALGAQSAQASSFLWPVEICPVGPISSGTVLWRYRNRLQLTAIVKATFSFVRDGRMTRIAPGAICRADAHFNEDARRGIIAACDLAPYRASTDIFLTGHAYVPPDATIRNVRIAVLRGKVLLDKTLQVAGERAAPAPGEALTTVSLDGFAPIPRVWPARDRLLRPVDRRAIEQPVAAIPSDFDWAYFQAAPADQRTSYLRGSEWLELWHLHPVHAELRTQIPEAKAAGKLYGLADDPEEDKGRDLLFHLDTLHIDTARGCCSITWRSTVPLAEGTDPSRLSVVAGIGTAGDPLELVAVEHARAMLAAQGDDMVETLPFKKQVDISFVPLRQTPEGTLVMSPGPSGLHQTAPLARNPSSDVRAPFAIAAPGVASRAAAAPIPGAPWSPAPHKTPPPPGGPGESTLLIEVPPEPEDPIVALAPPPATAQPAIEPPKAASWAADFAPPLETQPATNPAVQDAPDALSAEGINPAKKVPAHARPDLTDRLYRLFRPKKK